MNMLELEFGCGRGGSWTRKADEWYLSNDEPYELCGSCGEDTNDCLCYDRQAERAQCEADHQQDIREDR